MNRRRTSSFLIAMSLAICAAAQVANEGTANQIIAARQKNAALMKQYNWQCRTEVTVDGDLKDTRVDSVTYGPDGNLQRTEMSNQAAAAPRGFFKKRIAEDKKKEMEKLLKAIHEQVEQYTMSSAGAIINFMSQAKISAVKAPDGSALLQMTGSGVVNPGDTFTLTFDPSTHQAKRIEIASSADGHAFTVEGTFKSLKSGLSYMQFATIDVPDKNLNLQVHNFDYVAND